MDDVGVGLERHHDPRPLRAEPELLTRDLHDPATREYAARRTATGSSRKEILRLLKRYIARQVFAEIRRALTPPKIVDHESLT